jgi:hypothetical protein
MILICFCLKNLLTDLSHFSFLFKECVDKWLQINIFKGAKLETTATSPIANSVSTFSTADGKSKEAIQRTGSFKDNKKNAIKKESKNTSQLPKACYFLVASF